MGIPSVIEAALLPGLIGWGRTREMLLTGALFSAAEALGRLGVRAEGGAGEPRSMPRSDGWLAAIGRATPGGDPLAEGADEPLGARVGGGGHRRRHRRPVRGLHDRRAAGGDDALIAKQSASRTRRSAS